jgi:hypothetical protein
MQPYRVMAIDDGVADAVRKTRRSPRYGHQAQIEVATGYGPCRQCLRDFAVGQDRRILFTYDAFHGQESFPLPGPVFIHEKECERYPEDGGFPADARSRSLTLNAYASGRRLVAQRHVANGAVDAEIEQLLGYPDVGYIHVRDTDAGCYDFRIERLSGEEYSRPAESLHAGGSHE